MKSFNFLASFAATLAVTVSAAPRFYAAPRAVITGKADKNYYPPLEAEVRRGSPGDEAIEIHSSKLKRDEMGPVSE